MPNAKVAVTIEDKLLRDNRARRRRLLRELARLDLAEERGLAEEVLRDEVQRALR
jgi:hypothetical protein